MSQFNLTSYEKDVDEVPERGCGRRTAGIYACSGLSPYGIPMSRLTPCPPVPVPPWIEVKDLGSTIGPGYSGGTQHIWDRKGLTHYPNVADYWEETAHLGASVRLSPLMDYSVLGPRSGIYHIHDRAYIQNWEEYGTRSEFCRSENKNHILHEGHQAEEFCNGLWWQDIEGGTPMNSPGDINILRKMPSFSYAGMHRPKGVVPVYEQRFFLWTPISRIDILPGSPEETKGWEKSVKRSGLAYNFVGE